MKISELIAAAAEAVTAIETGVAMRLSLRAKPSNNPPPAPAMCEKAFLIGTALVAFSVVGAALIIRHGLPACPCPCHLTSLMTSHSNPR
jgi:hypothetical protein